MNNIAHLNIIPLKLMKEKKEYLTSALVTVIKDKKTKPVHYVDLMSLLEKHTCKGIQNFFEDTPKFLSFLQSKNTIFKITSDGNVSLIDPEKFAKILWRMPVQPEEKYLHKIGFNNNSGASNSTNISVPKNEKSVIMGSNHKIKTEIEEINLLDDDDDEDEENKMEFEL